MSSSRVPFTAARYFGCGEHPAYREHPTVKSLYHPQQGWRRYNGFKRISWSWCMRMRREGYEWVALSYQGRTADFSLKELTASHQH